MSCTSVMRINITSNQNVYNCVSVVQQPPLQRLQPHQPSSRSAAIAAGYTSSSRITNSNSITNNNSSLSPTTVNGSGNATNQVLPQQQQQHDVFSFRSKPQEKEGLDATTNSVNTAFGSIKRPTPFEVSCSPPSIQSAGSGDSRDAFLQNDYNDFSKHKGGDNHDDDDTTNSDNTDNQDTPQRPSNEKLLGTAFISFMTFALIQLCFAFIAGSQAMKGDSAAMIVDSMTYLSNWIAEKRKSMFDKTYIPPTPASFFSSSSDYDPVREAKRLKERARRKLVLTLEIVPPLISVSALIGITIIVLKQAIHVLLMDRYRQKQDQTDPNIHVMLAFSIFNLGLDVLNVFCFAKSKHLTGFQTLPAPLVDPHSHSSTVSTTMGDLTTNGGGGDSDKKKSTITRLAIGSYLKIDQSSSHDDEDGRNNILTSANDETCHSQLQQQKFNHVDSSPQSGDQAVQLQHGDGEEANLNMCSAYTHVFADTLRSIAVIIAAIIAVLVNNVTSEEADAAAAVVVSILILFSLIPLFQGLLQSLKEFFAIRAEEQSERMFANTRGIEIIAFRRSNSLTAAAATVSTTVASTTSEVV